GELENTMLHSHIKTTMLCRWLARLDSLPIIQECRDIFDRVYTPKSAENSSQEFAEDPINDIICVPYSAMTSAVPDDLYSLLKRRTTILHATLKFEGVIYSRASTHLGNSQVLFYPQGDRTLTPVPASIKYIYGTLTGELSFAAQRHLPLDRQDCTIDPFSIYPDFPAKMYSTELESRLENVKVTWVVSHFARWMVSGRHTVILFLSRD
ncbi:hypothetical protein CY34DRAFT_91769, partial [Suillus luteus UH-Slu-Lm8-n1]